MLLASPVLSEDVSGEDLLEENALSESGSNVTDSTENENSNFEEITGELDVGLTPDSAFYFLDTALDKIKLNLARDPAKKAVKGLEIAEERLQEVQAMAMLKKIEAMGKAEQEHSEVMFEVENAVEEIESKDLGEELESELEIEEKLEEHKGEVEKLTTVIHDYFNDDELDNYLTELMGSLDETVYSVEVKVQNQKGKTKIKITENGIDANQIEEDIKKGLEHAYQTAVTASNGVAENGLSNALEQSSKNDDKSNENSPGATNSNGNNPDDDSEETEDEEITGDETNQKGLEIESEEESNSGNINSNGQAKGNN